MENTGLQHTRVFPFMVLKDITNNFSKERVIGCGGSGVVYKGVFGNGEVIAVKKLNNHYDSSGEKLGNGEAQFHNELMNLIGVQHQNIIRLVGYCHEIQNIVTEYDGKRVLATVEERVLCLEYLQGGCLKDHISGIYDDPLLLFRLYYLNARKLNDPSLLAIQSLSTSTDESCGLEWYSRYNIIKGICEGLKYLHTGSENPIYHLDLKPENILLDRNMIPKIGDFGISRLPAGMQTCVTQNTSGTLGYMPPEYIFLQQISPKFDIFSLGVIMIQVVAGHEGHQNYSYMTSQEFIEHVQENWRKRPQTTVSSHTLEQIRTCTEIALRCVELEREKRPNITEIVYKLNTIDVEESSDIDQNTEAEEHTTLGKRLEGDASLSIPLEDSSRRIINGGHLHDLVPDTISSLSSEDNFLTVLDGSEQVDLKSLFTHLQDNPLTERSFNTSEGDIPMISVSEMQRLLQLKLYDTHTHLHQDGVGSLYHLKTLDLRGSSVRELSFIIRLINLKCLRADEITGVPGIGNLTSLEELRLDYVGRSVNFVLELGKLKKLRELDVWIQELDKTSNETLVESLRNLHNIEVLRLMISWQGEVANWNNYVPPRQLSELRLTIAFPGLPKWISASSVPNLSHLSVDLKAVDQQDVDMLGYLPKLVSLNLQIPSDVFLSIKGDSLFPKLRSFDTSAPFRFLPGAMPALKSLHFKVDVRALKHAGFALNDFATLENLLRLQSVEVEINFRGARPVHAIGAEEAVKRTVDNHPNNPTASISLSGEPDTYIVNRLL